MHEHETIEKGQKVAFKIQGRTYEGYYEESLLGALRRYGYEVPSLCYHEAVSAYGACRLCLVEVGKGRKRRLTTSCNYPVLPDIEVFLDTDTVVRNRKTVLRLLLAMAPAAEEIHELAAEYGVTDTPFVQDTGKECILCGLCNRVCDEVVGAKAIGFSGRGFIKDMTSPFDEVAEACIGCGACVQVCPTNCIGIKEENNIRSIIKWHRDLPMKSCKKCGRAFAPTFQLNYFATLTKLDRDFFDVCQDCR
jgi:NADH dehydrogenase/NADH:ubiquinone oxidoreductase subunit G